MKIKHKYQLCLAILMLLSLPLIACSTQAASQGKDLENIMWQLQSYGETGHPIALLSGTEISVTFDSVEGRVYGSAGANTYSGSYEVIDNKLSILELAWTEMYRLNPPGVMEQEAEYLNIFQAAENFLIQGDTLQINSGTKLLTYSEKTQGTLQGHVTIGPITPVEISGEKPTVPPEVYEARKIMIYDESGEKLVAQVDIDTTGNYEINLKPGAYNVDINRIGIDRSADVPRVIEVVAGKTIVLDIDIDTGIR